MARFTPPASSSADPACEDHPWKLETWLLENSTSHATVFQKILTKYDREYGEDELGGQLLDMYSSETAYTQVDKLFVERNWTDSSDEDQTAISSGSELESSRGQEEDPGYRRYPSSGLSSSDSENEVELKAKLHEKVVRIKKEINWDEEERWYQQKQEAAELSSSSDEENGLQHLPKSHLPSERMYEDDVVSGYISSTEKEMRSPVRKRCRRYPQKKLFPVKKITECSTALLQISPCSPNFHTPSSQQTPAIINIPQQTPTIVNTPTRTHTPSCQISATSPSILSCQISATPPHPQAPVTPILSCQISATPPRPQAPVTPIQTPPQLTPIHSLHCQFPSNQCHIIFSSR